MMWDFFKKQTNNYKKREKIYVLQEGENKILQDEIWEGDEGNLTKAVNSKVDLRLAESMEELCENMGKTRSNEDALWETMKITNLVKYNLWNSW